MTKLFGLCRRSPPPTAIMGMRGGRCNRAHLAETGRLVQAAERYGVELQLVVWPRMWHGWHVLAPVLPEGTQALRTLGETIRQRTNG